MKNQTTVRTLTYAAVCLALAIVLPFLTGQIPSIGQMLSPMHIPALLCGFLCGPVWGAVIGFAAPILRSLFFSMPPMFPGAVSMACELAVYGGLSGFLYRRLPKRVWAVYVSLLSAMVCGRIVWGLVRLSIAAAQKESFTFAVFLAGAVTGSIPGIICQIILVPLIVLALRRAHLMEEDENR